MVMTNSFTPPPLLWQVVSLLSQPLYKYAHHGFWAKPAINLDGYAPADCSIGGFHQRYEFRYTRPIAAQWHPAAKCCHLSPAVVSRIGNAEKEMRIL